MVVMVVGVVDFAVDVVEVIEVLTALKNNSYSLRKTIEALIFIYHLKESVYLNLPLQASGIFPWSTNTFIGFISSLSKHSPSFDINLQTKSPSFSAH